MPRSARPPLSQPSAASIDETWRLENQLVIVEDRAAALCQVLRYGNLEEDDFDAMAQMCEELAEAAQAIETFCARASRWRRWQAIIASGDAAR